MLSPKFSAKLQEGIKKALVNIRQDSENGREDSSRQERLKNRWKCDKWIEETLNRAGEDES